MEHLLKKRMLMSAAKDNEMAALYSLTNGSFKPPASGSLGDVVVSNGNHVNLYKRWGNSNWSYNIGNWSEPPFTLHAGDVVTMTVDCTVKTTGNFRMRLIWDGGSMNVGTVTAVGTHTFTITMDADHEITQMSVYVLTGSAKTRHEYDVYMYVNGVRYI